MSRKCGRVSIRPLNTLGSDPSICGLDVDYRRRLFGNPPRNTRKRHSDILAEIWLSQLVPSALDCVPGGCSKAVRVSGGRRGNTWTDWYEFLGAIRSIYRSLYVASASDKFPAMRRNPTETHMTQGSTKIGLSSEKQSTLLDRRVSVAPMMDWDARHRQAQIVEASLP